MARRSLDDDRLPSRTSPISDDALHIHRAVFGSVYPDLDDYQLPGAVSPADSDVAREIAIVKSVLETYNHEYEVRRPHEVIWDRVWKRINNRWDFTRKRSWQSQKAFPAMVNLALKFAWELVKALERAGDKWFEVMTYEPEWQPLLDVPRDLTMEFIRSSGSDPANNFLNVFFEAVFYGLITGSVYIRAVSEDDGYIDMRDDQGQASLTNLFQDAELVSAIPSFGFGSVGGKAAPDTFTPRLPEESGWRLRFDAINGRFLFRDTASRRRPRYYIHTQELTRGEYREEAEARGWRYTEEAIASPVTSGTTSASPDRGRDVIQKDLTRDPKRLDTMRLKHYYGTLFDGMGNIVFKDSYAVIVNDKFVVWGPEPLPYWHGQIPIVAGHTLKLPGAPYSKSILELNVDTVETRVELDNAILDFTQQSINPPTEVDVDQLNAVKPGQLASGLFPGKVFEVQKSALNQGPAVARSAMPDVAPGVFQAVGYLKQEFSEFTMLADTAAMPRTRNRISAKEFQERAAASSGPIELCIKNIERDVLAPFCWQVFLLGLQKYPQPMWEAFIDRKIAAFSNRTRTVPPGAAPANPSPAVMETQPQPQQQPTGQPVSQKPMPEVPGVTQAPDYENPGLVEKLKIMRDWGPQTRFTEFAARFRFEVKVYTALETRREVIERIAQLMQAAEANPVFASRIKWHALAEEYVRALEFDPERVLWPDAGDTADTIAAPTKDAMAPRPVSLIPPVAPHMPPGGGYA